MRTPPISHPPLGPTGYRSTLILFLAAALGVTAWACGKDGGGPNPTLSIALDGNGQGTVTGTPGGLNCSNANSSGTIGGTCDEDVADGTAVTLSASPNTGSTFTGWSGNGVTCTGIAACTITVTESRTITATFEAAAATQLLTVVGGGSGTGSGTVVSDPAGIDCTISSGTAGATGCSAPFNTDAPVQLIETGDLVAWGGACSGTTCSTVMSEPRTVIATFAADPEATQLAFVVQPGAVQTGEAITPPVQVAVQDEAGLTVAGRTDAITLEIATGPAGATLGGQVTRDAVNGVATFPDLTLDLVGAGYTLKASASELPDEISSDFNVSAEPVAELAFSVQPATTVAGVSIASIKVEIRDAETGAVLTSRTDEISISIQNNPGGSTLGGDDKAPAVAGVATFSDLKLTKAATGYTLAASTPNASGDISDPFTILAGPARLVIKNSTDPQNAAAGTAVAVRPSVKVTDNFNNPVAGVDVTWVVTGGEGTVVASNEDPVVRPTGPLGLSTAVSWTLGTEVGVANNTLRASVSDPDINGSPITFTASATIPPGKGIFTGELKQTNNAGQLSTPVTDATLTFVNLNPPETALGSTESKNDGSFVSPPLPAGAPYRIEIESDVYKSIEYAKPPLLPNEVSIGVLGMVVDNPEGGLSGLHITVNLDPAPAEAILVHVEVYRGYYLAETESDINETIGNDDPPLLSGQQIDVTVGDWGVMTVRIFADDYLPVNRQVILDQPNSSATFEVTLTQP